MCLKILIKSYNCAGALCSYARCVKIAEYAKVFCTNILELGCHTPDHKAQVF